MNTAIRRQSTNRGDTIIEVLISIAIVGLVIAGAYALANRSLQQGITANERTEALKLAEGQIELLKYRQKTAWSDSFVTVTGINNSCLNPLGVSANPTTWNPVKNNFTPTSPPTNLRQKAPSPPTAPGYSAICNPATASNSKYFINITVPTPETNRPTYLITVRWNAIGGGQNQSQLYYRF